MSKENIYIIIPAYNESATIQRVIANLINCHFTEIIVVDDGSIDNTAQIASTTGVEVLRHLINRGQGAALRTGIEYTLKNYNPDIIVTFDADGQHKASEISKLCNPLLNESVDIVLGSRFLDNKTEMPYLRKVMLKSAVLFTYIFSHIRLTDTHNGFRAFSKDAAQKITITQRGMEHASEIIDEIKKKKLRYKEVPVEILYTKYSQKKGQRASQCVKLGFNIILSKLIKQFR